MAARPRLFKPFNLLAMALVGLSLGWGLAYFASLYSPGGDDPAGEASALLARQPGPIMSLASVDEPINLGYLQQFCPADSDPASPGLCNLDPEQAAALTSQIPAEATACWQQIYDYAFGPLADRIYFGGQAVPPADPIAGTELPPAEPETPPADTSDCHQGVITVLVQPAFVSRIEADNNDRARFQDILFIMAAVIEYEAYRTRVPTNLSNIDGSFSVDGRSILSYYQLEHINAPGTWNAQPAVAGGILSLSRNPSGPGDIGVDPETGELLLPTSGRWGDADQIGDPELIMIFHRAACTEGSNSPLALGGLRRYAIVYRQTGEDGFSCHSF